jgi:hypothetical protein
MSEPVWVPLGATKTNPWMIVFPAGANEPPLASYATFDLRNGHVVLDFDAAASEFAIFRGVLHSGYEGRGINVKLIWTATTAVTGNVYWIVYIERLVGQDIDADGWATAMGVLGAAPATSGVPLESTIALPHGTTYMDGLVAGEHFRLRVLRYATDPADTMAGDAELLAVVVTEQ